ncbi:MAG: hypothetical protein IT190_09845, partial [Microbacteriaceae bacterium]|nr:hypothetical protein [Microbacteriaceae bacterium]
MIEHAMGANRCFSAVSAAVSIALAVASCDDAALAVNCAGGPLLELEGHPYCVYGSEHVAASDGGFRCPRGVPTRIELGAGTVCTDRDVPPCELPGEVCTLLGRCCEPDAGVPDGDLPDVGAVDLGPSPDARVTPDARVEEDARVETDSGPSDAGEPTVCPGTAVVEGPEQIADSYLVGATCGEDRRGSNQGAGESFQVADIPWACFWLTHGIMRIDVEAALPADAQVVSASLNLFVERECSVSV